MDLHQGTVSCRDLSSGVAGPRGQNCQQRLHFAHCLPLFCPRGVRISLRAAPSCRACWGPQRPTWPHPEAERSPVVVPRSVLGSSRVTCLPLRPACVRRERAHSSAGPGGLCRSQAWSGVNCCPAPMAEGRDRLTSRGNLGNCSQEKGAVGAWVARRGCVSHSKSCPPPCPGQVISPG